MAELTHFVSQVVTAQTTVATTAEEETNYTIPWSSLTGAGFAASDDVLILVGMKSRNDNANNNTLFQVGLGTTYAGRVDVADSLQRMEASTTTLGGMQYVWMDRRTLVVNENLYFSTWVTAGTGTYETFFCLVLKLGALTSNDFLYAETTPSGDASTTYTGGASVTTPVSGDWLVIGFTRWLVDSISDDYLMRIDAGGTFVSELDTEGEDTGDEACMGTIAYRAGIGASVALEVEYRTLGGAHDCVGTKIFALRLGAFRDHDGAHTTNTITHSVLDTFQEYAAFNTFAHAVTGNLIAMGLPFHTTNESTKRPYGRVQLADADWDVANRNRAGVLDHGAASQIGPFLWAYGSVAAGTLNIDFDVAEDGDVSPTYACDEQVAVVFSLELAVAAFTLAADPGSYEITGAAAGVLATRLLSADAGSYAITGIDALLSHGFMLDAESGAYVLTGADAALLAARLLNAEFGSYVLSGADAILAAGIILQADAGSYLVSGADAQVLAGLLLLADPGSYLLTGEDASLLAARLLQADPGVYAITGAAADLLATRLLNADPGVYLITGADADLIHTVTGAFVLFADPGSYVVTGADAGVLAARILQADPGSYVVSGVDALLAAGRLLDAEAGIYLIVGADASVMAGHVLLAESGVYIVTGAPADLLAGRVLQADPGVYAVTGVDAAALVAFVLQADPGAYLVSGADAQLLFGGGGAFILNAEPGVYLITGAPAELIRSLMAPFEVRRVGMREARRRTIGEARRKPPIP